MPSAIVRAFALVDKHAQQRQQNDDDDDAHASVTLGPRAATAAAAAARHARRDHAVAAAAVMSPYAHAEPLPTTLPVFRVCARDGPSPYDAHRGRARCTAHALWEAATDFALVDDASEDDGDDDGGVCHVQTLRERSHRRGRADDVHTAMVTAAAADSSTRVCAATAAAATRASDACVRCRVVACERFHTVTLPTLVMLQHTPRHTCRDDACRRDDSAAATWHEQAAAAAERQLVRTLRRRKAKLQQTCVQAYPHGALGLVDSPYDDDDDGKKDSNVYRAHRTRLLRQDARERRQCRRHYGAELQAMRCGRDSLHGGVPLREDVVVHGPRACAPPDNLFGAVLL